MDNLKTNMIINPNEGELTVTVLIPSFEEGRLIAVGDIDATETYYETKMQEAVGDKMKESYYDRARATCKWASTCSASLNRHAVVEKKLVMVFKFPSREQFNDFLKDVVKNVEGAVEKSK